MVGKAQCSVDAGGMLRDGECPGVRSNGSIVLLELAVSMAHVEEGRLDVVALVTAAVRQSLRGSARESERRREKNDIGEDCQDRPS